MPNKNGFGSNKRVNYIKLKPYLPKGMSFDDFSKMSYDDMLKYQEKYTKDAAGRKIQKEENDALRSFAKSTDNMRSMYQEERSSIWSVSTFPGAWSDEEILANPKGYLALIERNKVGHAVASVKEYDRTRKLLLSHGKSILMEEKSSVPAEKKSEPKKHDELSQMLSAEERQNLRKEQLRRERLAESGGFRR